MIRRIDWAAETAKADQMSDAALRGAIDDLISVLPHSDSLDRSDIGNRGGFYRDLISVYRVVLLDRHRAQRSCPHCAKERDGQS